MMDPPWPRLWNDLHGGSTHLLIALAIASVLFDLGGYFIRREPYGRDLRAAGFYALLLGVLGVFAAVLSGLVVSRWETLGSGTLALHHYFAWPAFGLFTAMAAWRQATAKYCSPPTAFPAMGTAARADSALLSEGACLPVWPLEIRSGTGYAVKCPRTRESSIPRRSVRCSPISVLSRRRPGLRAGLQNPARDSTLPARASGPEGKT